MRFPSLLSGFALFAAVCAAQTPHAAVPTATTAPKGLTFSYDPQRGGLAANGFTVPAEAAPAIVSPVETFHGTVNVNLTIHVFSVYSPTTTIKCSALVFGGDFTNLQGGILTANGIATMNTDDVATCKLTLPFSWTLNPTPGDTTGIFLIYAASAQAANGDVIRSFTQTGGALPLLEAAPVFTVSGSL